MGTNTKEDFFTIELDERIRSATRRSSLVRGFTMISVGISAAWFFFMAIVALLNLWQWTLHGVPIKAIMSLFGFIAVLLALAAMLVGVPISVLASKTLTLATLDEARSTPGWDSSNGEMHGAALDASDRYDQMFFNIVCTSTNCGIASSIITSVVVFFGWLFLAFFVIGEFWADALALIALPILFSILGALIEGNARKKYEREDPVLYSVVGPQVDEFIKSFQ